MILDYFEIKKKKKKKNIFVLTFAITYGRRIAQSSGRCPARCPRSTEEWGGEGGGGGESHQARSSSSSFDKQD